MSSPLRKLTDARCLVLLSSEELLRDCGFVFVRAGAAAQPRPLLSDSLLFLTGCAASRRGVSFGDERCNPA